MNLKEIILYFFPFTTSEAYMALTPFITSAVILGIVGAFGTLICGRYLAGRTAKAYGRSVRSRKRKVSSPRTSVKKPLKYRSDDPRRITVRDVRFFFLFLLALSVLAGSMMGLTAAYRDIARRDAVTGLFQVISVHSQPAGQGMVQVIHLFDQNETTLFFRPNPDFAAFTIRGRYRLEFLPRTHMLTRAEELQPEE